MADLRQLPACTPALTLGSLYAGASSLYAGPGAGRGRRPSTVCGAKVESAKGLLGLARAPTAHHAHGHGPQSAVLSAQCIVRK